MNDRELLRMRLWCDVCVAATQRDLFNPPAHADAAVAAFDATFPKLEGKSDPPPPSNTR